jgi:uncharacterized protein YneF (UPF0154 family)
MVELSWWVFVLILLGVLIVGAVVGFFVSRKIFTN